jgi:hypothetical protein
MTQPRAQAFRLLQFAFVVAPIVFGLDKFVNFLVYWPMYLAPWISGLLHVDAQVFMYGVGVVEVLAGILVAVRPQIGAYIVTVWLWGIIVYLLTFSGYYDIALRDFGLSLGALSLGRLAQAYAAEREAAREEPAVEMEYHEPRPLRVVPPAARTADAAEGEERRAA